VGGKHGTPKAPTIVNLAVTPCLMDERESDVTTHLFWDGRAASLEDQVSGPIENVVEMASSHRDMVASLARSATPEATSATASSGTKESDGNPNGCSSRNRAASAVDARRLASDIEERRGVLQPGRQREPL
jgi:hypothetical protein